MSLSNRDDWNLVDPAPELPLANIESVSVRASALVARSSSALLREHFVQIIGVTSMLAGLEYHYANFLSVLSGLPAQFGRDISAAQHEAIAWLNRVGQFHYFSRSELVARRLPAVSTPRIEYVLPFRMKHAAHRSIDVPRKDTGNQQLNHAMMLSALGGSLWIPRSGIDRAAEASFPPGSDTHCLVFQVHLDDGVRHLNVEEEHPRILEEMYTVLHCLLD